MNRPASRLAHRALYRVVRGAVRSAMHAHPDYLTDKGRQSMADSIAKRVTGAIAALGAQKSRKG